MLEFIYDNDGDIMLWYNEKKYNIDQLTNMSEYKLYKLFDSIKYDVKQDHFDSTLKFQVSMFMNHIELARKTSEINERFKYIDYE